MEVSKVGKLDNDHAKILMVKTYYNKERYRGHYSVPDNKADEFVKKYNIKANKDENRKLLSFFAGGVIGLIAGYKAVKNHKAITAVVTGAALAALGSALYTFYQIASDKRFLKKYNASEIKN